MDLWECLDDLETGDAEPAQRVPASIRPALELLGGLALGAASESEAPGAFELAELLATAIRIASLSGVDIHGEEVLLALEPAYPLFDACARELAVEIRSDLAGFRHAAVGLIQDCYALESLEPLPLDSLQVARDYLKELALLDGVMPWLESAAARLRRQWLQVLVESLRQAWKEAGEALAPREIAEHLWPLADEARALGLSWILALWELLHAHRVELKDAVRKGLLQDAGPEAPSSTQPPAGDSLLQDAGPEAPSPTQPPAGDSLLQDAGPEAPSSTQPPAEDSLLPEAGPEAHGASGRPVGGLEVLRLPVAVPRIAGGFPPNRPPEVSIPPRKLAPASMRLAAEGMLPEKDFELIRRAARGQPGFWAVAHRQALYRDGFTTPVYLVPGVEGEWTAPPSFQDAEEELRSVRILPEAKALALPQGSDVARPGDGDAERGESPDDREARDDPGEALPDSLDKGLARCDQGIEILEDGTPLEAIALVSKNLPLARARLRAFGDEKGLWCEMKPLDGSATERCREQGLLGEASGDRAQLALLRLTENGGAGEKTRFRPGPLRPALGELDRAYSPRAYVVTVGESLLRGVLGWGFGGDCAERLNRAAREAGIQTYGELKTLLLGTKIQKEGDLFPELPRSWTDPYNWPAPWIASLPVIGGQDGTTTLGERWSQLIQRGSFGDPSLFPELGAEIDTLAALGQGADPRLRPKGGDLFVLIPTDTATAILSALLIGRWLTRDLAGVRLRIQVAGVLRQKEELRSPENGFNRPHGEEPEPLEMMTKLTEDLLERLLRHEAADPVLVIPGGLKTQTIPLVAVGFERCVPCVYKPRLGEVPLVLRWDLVGRQLQERIEGENWRYLPVPASAPQAAGSEYTETSGGSEPVASTLPVALLVSVGTSLLFNYKKDVARRTGQRLQEIPTPTGAKLAHWALHGAQSSPDDSPSLSPGIWELSAELTTLEAWLRERDYPGLRDCRLSPEPGAADGKRAYPELLLLGTDSHEGRLCLHVLEMLLEDCCGLTLHHHSTRFPELSLEKPGFSSRDGQLFKEVLVPASRFVRELRRDGRRVEILVSGGQVLTAALLQFVGRVTSCDVHLLSNLSQDGKQVSPLLRFPQKGPSRPPGAEPASPAEPNENGT